MRGARHGAPFSGINCSAIPEQQLLDPERFGHEKGAFTGARFRREGRFKAAHGGNLFVHEVGDLLLALQLKLRRVLQDLAVRRAGSTSSSPGDEQIISATHRALEQRVRQGAFRAERDCRRNVIPLHMPRLAARAHDVRVLLDHFPAAHARRSDDAKKRFAPAAIAYLAAAEWPGNTRQLINGVEMQVTLTPGAVFPLVMARRAWRN